MNNKIKKLTKGVKSIGLKVRLNVLDTPHPTLVALVVSAIMVTAVTVVISMLTADLSQLAYAEPPAGDRQPIGA